MSEYTVVNMNKPYVPKEYSSYYVDTKDTTKPSASGAHELKNTGVKTITVIVGSSELSETVAEPKKVEHPKVLKFAKGGADYSSELGSPSDIFEW
jgi:hypothetical protein